MTTAVCNPNIDATTIFCPACGKPMRVALQHMYVAVSCPSCQKRVKPWRVVEAANMAAAPMVRPDGYSTRNRWVAGALAILLGPFGVHRFYMGFVGVGILQVLLTVLSLGLLSPVVAIWAFIEGILCFCGVMKDVDGRLLSG